MRLQWSRLLSSMLVLGSFAVTAAAQLAAPTSGEVTVRCVEGLDSARSQPGAISHAVVTKSSISSIPKNAQAVVQLGIDPSSGGLNIELVQITVAGQNLKTASSKAVLSGGLVPGLNGALNKADKTGNKTTLAGPHVFVPGNTAVQFTLIDPGTQASASSTQPRRVTAPEPPDVWQPAAPPFPGPAIAGDTAVSLSVIAVNGARRGHAHIIVSCTNKNFISVHFTIAQALLGYKVDDFNNVNEPGQTDEDAKARFQFEGTSTPIFLSGNSGEDSPVHLEFAGPRNTFPDSFFAAANTGKAAKLTILAPDGKGTSTIAEFTTPADSAPLVAVASPCLATQAAEEAERKAKILASCPVKPGKDLVLAQPKRMPGGKVFDGEDNEGQSVSYDLTSPAPKSGQHAVLECVYAPQGTKTPPKVVSPANRVLVPLPANTISCEVVSEPYTATCSRK